MVEGWWEKGVKVIGESCVDQVEETVEGLGSGL